MLIYEKNIYILYKCNGVHLYSGGLGWLCEKQRLYSELLFEVNLYLHIYKYIFI